MGAVGDFSSALYNNRYVYAKHGFVPLHPRTLHKLRLGEVVGWDDSLCRGSVLSQYIATGATQTADWGSMNIATKAVRVFKVHGAVQAPVVVGGAPVASVQASFGYSFEDDDQYVIKAEQCSEQLWDASKTDLEERLHELIKGTKLASGHYAVVLGIITAKSCTVFTGGKNQVSFSSALDVSTVCIPLSIKAGIEAGTTTEATVDLGPLSDSVVGYQIWSFRVRWWTSKPKMDSTVMSTEETKSATPAIVEGADIEDVKEPTLGELKASEPEVEAEEAQQAAQAESQ